MSYGVSTLPKTSTSKTASLHVKSMVEAVRGASEFLLQFVCVGRVNFSNFSYVLNNKVPKVSNEDTSTNQ